MNIPHLVSEILCRTPEMPAVVAREQYFCSCCLRMRKMSISVVHSKGVLYKLFKSIPNGRDFENVTITEDTEPSLAHLVCEQCRTWFAAMFYVFENKPRLVVFPNNLAGFESIPKEVAFNLDQALRAQAVGAKAAAIAMYRTTLEQILADLGFTEGMLDDKIKKLEEAKATSDAPKWVKQINTETLHVLKRLGNQAVHPRDLPALSAFPAEYLAPIQIAVFQVIDIAYKKPLIERLQAEGLAELDEILSK